MKGVTKHQLEILMVVGKVQEETGQLADLDQVLERLSWSPTKESLQFSIRASVAKSLIFKSGIQTRRGRNRVCFGITNSGNHILDPNFKPELKEEIKDMPLPLFDQIGTDSVQEIE